jgi:hypothetical protein
VSRREGKGRVLEASRNIKEGEVVMVDKAMVIVPGAKVVCLGCLNDVSPPTENQDNSEFSINSSVCPECCFPMCGKEDCDTNKWHSKYECLSLKKADAANKLFKNALMSNESESQEPGLSPEIRISQFYHVIAILRFILTQQNCSQVIKEQLQMLTDHNESRYVL